MEERSGKRHVGRLVIPRKGSNLLRRDAAGNRNEDAQFCNRIGCSGRLKYNRSNCGFNEKAQHSKPSFYSSNGKEIIGSSSKTSGIPNARKSLHASQRKHPSHLETDSLSSSIHGESDIQELISSPRRDVTGFRSEIRQCWSTKVPLTRVRSPTVAADNKPRVVRTKPRSDSQNALLGASASTASNSIGLGARNNSFGSRYGLRNLKCNSISDVIPQTGSPRESKIGRRDALNKRSQERESSSFSRGRRSSGTTSVDVHVSSSTNGISISSSRQIRNWTVGGTAISVRARGSLNSINGTRLSNNDNSNALSFGESTVMMPQLPRPDTPFNASVNNLSFQSSSEASSSDPSYNICDRNDRNAPNIIPFTSIDQVVSPDSPRYNLDGAAEMLMALEGIEQDEGPTYERLLALETNLVFGSINFHDQHRDMRLDIDDMTYEELLALEERMGTVSTALSEEALAKSIRKSIYQTSSLEIGTKGCCDGEDEIKCSICQEEYEIGDEIGKLECDHEYHAACVQRWLQLKNWCPICKSSASPTS